MYSRNLCVRWVLLLVNIIKHNFNFKTTEISLDYGYYPQQSVCVPYTPLAQPPQATATYPPFPSGVVQCE